MRFRGGGVGHKSTREATGEFLAGSDSDDAEDAAGKESSFNSLAPVQQL